MDYDKLLELFKKRRSIRCFDSTTVPAPLVEKLLEAARWAPSAGNRQGFRFLIVKPGETLLRMGQAVQSDLLKLKENLREDLQEESQDYFKHFKHFVNSPLVIVPIHRDTSKSGLPYGVSESLSSVSAATMQLLLAAEALGLGACWMTGPLVAQNSLRQILDVPQGWSLSALIAVGYPAEEPEPPARRKLENLVRYLD